MEVKHTQEPWAAYEVGNSRFIKSKAGDLIASGFLRMEDARRAIACVNACAGISTENLEENLPVKELARRYNAVIKQRDELLAVIETEHGGVHYEPECAICEVVDRVKGGV